MSSTGRRRTSASTRPWPASRPEGRGARPPGFEHSPWQLLEHIRLAHDDILDFCLNAKYVHNMTWPDDYWPKAPGAAQ